MTSKPATLVSPVSSVDGRLVARGFGSRAVARRGWGPMAAYHVTGKAEGRRPPQEPAEILPVGLRKEFDTRTRRGAMPAHTAPEKPRASSAISTSRARPIAALPVVAARRDAAAAGHPAPSIIAGPDSGTIERAWTTGATGS